MSAHLGRVPARLADVRLDPETLYVRVHAGPPPEDVPASGPISPANSWATATDPGPADWGPGVTFVQRPDGQWIPAVPAE